MCIRDRCVCVLGKVGRWGVEVEYSCLPGVASSSVLNVFIIRVACVIVSPLTFYLLAHKCSATSMKD